MAYGFALPNNPNDVYSLVLSVGTAPPPAPQTKLGPFMLRLPPKIPDGAVEEDANPDSCSSGSNSNDWSGSNSDGDEVRDEMIMEDDAHPESYFSKYWGFVSQWSK